MEDLALHRTLEDDKLRKVMHQSDKYGYYLDIRKGQGYFTISVRYRDTSSSIQDFCAK